MKFWASAELFVAADPAQEKVRHYVEPFLNAAFSGSSLAALDCKIRYIPIIMPENMRDRYPARSELLRKERIYDCAPQLDYNVFVEDTFEDQLREYVRGIEESAVYLGKLGATPQQVEEFRTILDSVFAHALAEQASETRH